MVNQTHRERTPFRTRLRRAKPSSESRAMPGPARMLVVLLTSHLPVRLRGWRETAWVRRTRISPHEFSAERGPLIDDTKRELDWPRNSTTRTTSGIIRSPNRSNRYRLCLIGLFGVPIWTGPVKRLALMETTIMRRLAILNAALVMACLASPAPGQGMPENIRQQIDQHLIGRWSGHVDFDGKNRKSDFEY